ncbi:MAG: type II 3-dehydroquinate dehydratase [Dysosmobacter sp.]
MAGTPTTTCCPWWKRPAGKRHFPVFYQSNHEGDLIARGAKRARLTCGIILNPGGYTHTSIAPG